MHPPSLAFPEKYIKVEDVATSLFRRDRLYIVQLLEENYFTSAARKRITTNPLSKKPETMFTPSCTLKSTLWLKALVTSAQAADEEELDDSEDEDESESCIIRKKNSFKFSLVVTNIFCHQTLAEGKFVIILYPVYYVSSTASIFF